MTIEVTGTTVDVEATSPDSVTVTVGQNMPTGAWWTYTPTLTCGDPFGLFGGAVDPTLGSGAVQQGWYQKVGRVVWGRARIVFGTGASEGTGWYRVSLPVTPRASVDQPVGVGLAVDASPSNVRVLSAAIATTFATGALTLFIDNAAVSSASNPASNPAGSGAPWSWTTSDTMVINFFYEAAS